MITRPPLYARVGLFLIGLGVFGWGLRSLLGGHAFYQSFWGDAVFAPIPVLVGAAVMLLAFRKTS